MNPVLLAALVSLGAWLPFRLGVFLARRAGRPRPLWISMLAASSLLWCAPLWAGVPAGGALMALVPAAGILGEVSVRGRPSIPRLAAAVLALGLLLALLLAAILSGGLGEPGRLFEGRTLLALVRATPGTFESEFAHEADRTRAVARKGTPRIDLEVRVCDAGRPGTPRRAVLSGDRWGLGMQVVSVSRWLLVFGPRHFYRVTSAEARHKDAREAHWGERIEDEREARAALDRRIPLLGGTVGGLLGAGAETRAWEVHLYVPVSDGEFWAVYAAPSGPPAPEKLTREEWERRTGR